MRRRALEGYDGESSVLGAAVSRRIEEGIVALRRYVHPYNYLGEGGGNDGAASVEGAS